jgi:2-hydroxy-3-keto-5-methylthiopentenyl-1-phosphate phosphatase
MRFAGAKEENGLIVLRFKGKVNHYFLVVPIYFLLLTMYILGIKNFIDWILRHDKIIYIIIIIAIDIFHFVYRIVLERNLIFHTDNQKVIMEVVLLRISLFEIVYPKDKVVISRGGSNKSLVFTIRALKFADSSLLLVLDSHEDVVAIKQALAEFGLDIKLIED